MEKLKIEKEKTAKRVYFGSCKPEWYLFENGVYVGFWDEYHQGVLPKEWKLNADNPKS